MNIISNDCIVGKIYKKLNKPYQTPFVWNSISLSDFIILIKNYKSLIETDEIKNITVDFSEPKFGRFPKCAYINLNNLLNIYFTHHIQNNNYKTPFKTNVDLYYYDILSYLKEKWLKRCDLIDKNKKPIFIIDDMFVPPGHTYTNVDIKNIINLETDYKRFIVTTNENLKQFENDKIMIFKKSAPVVNTTIIAENILKDKQAKKFLNIE